MYLVVYLSLNTFFGHFNIFILTILQVTLIFEIISALRLTLCILEHYEGRFKILAFEYFCEEIQLLMLVLLSLGVIRREESRVDAGKWVVHMRYRFCPER